MRTASGMRVLSLLFLALWALACRHPHASGPLRQEAYVWQRSWNPAVRQAIQQASGISGFVALAAEGDLAKGALKRRRWYQRPPAFGMRRAARTA